MNPAEPRQPSRVPILDKASFGGVSTKEELALRPKAKCLDAGHLATAGQMWLQRAVMLEPELLQSGFNPRDGGS